MNDSPENLLPTVTPDFEVVLSLDGKQIQVFDKRPAPQSQEEYLVRLAEHQAEIENLQINT